MIHSLTMDPSETIQNITTHCQNEGQDTDVHKLNVANINHAEGTTNSCETYNVSQYRTGPGEKQYMCSVCHKHFHRASGLKTHMLIHTGEKPHTCKICQKQFTQGSTLKAHIPLHTGEKPHTCKLCNKQYLQANNLKTHLRSHTGEKRHSCEICQ